MTSCLEIVLVESRFLPSTQKLMRNWKHCLEGMKLNIFPLQQTCGYQMQRSHTWDTPFITLIRGHGSYTVHACKFPISQNAILLSVSTKHLHTQLSSGIQMQARCWHYFLKYIAGCIDKIIANCVSQLHKHCHNITICI